MYLKGRHCHTREERNTSLVPFEHYGDYGGFALPKGSKKMDPQSFAYQG